MMKSTCGVWFALAFVLCIVQSNTEPLDGARKPTTIRDLPGELLLIIYESCDLVGLNGLASLHPFFRQMAESTFKKQYGDVELRISSNGLNIQPNEAHTPIKICDMDTMFLTLQNFGHLFTKLHVDYGYFNETECERINGHLNEYTADTLIEFSLNRIDGLTRPFRNVEVVKFDSQGNAVDIVLSDIFPAVRSMTFWSVRGFSPSVINHHYPHLEAITEHMGFDESLKELLQLNPQLKKLEIRDVKWDFLHLINTILPNLENLKIRELVGDFSAQQFEGEPIHFENVKYFGLYGTKFIRFDTLPISFGKLELINVYILDNIIFDIVRRHKGLKIVTISNRGSRYLQRIIEELPLLEEYRSMDSIENMDSVNRFAQYMEDAKNLKLIMFWQCKPEFQNALIERTNNEWEMAEVGREYNVAFVRR